VRGPCIAYAFASGYGLHNDHGRIAGVVGIALGEENCAVLKGSLEFDSEAAGMGIGGSVRGGEDGMR